MVETVCQETLKWIRANGGRWKKNIVNSARMNGHIEVADWIVYAGGPWHEYD